jgi:ribonuclease BN (tRNA processing enzyme)
MKLQFLGTKGEIEEETSRHRLHSSLLITSKRFKLLLDHGLENRPLSAIKPNAILITHAHPDHFVWLKKDEDFSGKIYLTPESAKRAKYKKNFVLIKTNRWFRVGPFTVFAYPVGHSLIAPAVGFKIKKGKTLVYNPDILTLPQKAVLKGVDVYIGDSSSVKNNLVRRKNGQIFGHTRMSTQVNWCQKAGIKKIIFTHLGKEALKIGDRKLSQMLAKEDLEVKIAHDGMTIGLKER